MTKVLLWVVVAAVALGLASSDVMAQCPLCKMGLGGDGAPSAKAMNLGIVVLLIPPVSIFCSVFWLAFKRRKGGDVEDGEE